MPGNQGAGQISTGAGGSTGGEETFYVHHFNI